MKLFQCACLLPCKSLTSVVCLRRKRDTFDRRCRSRPPWAATPYTGDSTVTSVTSAKDSLLAGLTSVVTFVPKLLAFLVILVIGLLIAKAISKAVGKILQK